MKSKCFFRLCSTVIIMVMLLAACVGNAYADTNPSKIGSGSAEILQGCEDNDIIDFVEIGFVVTEADNDNMREILTRLLEESDSEFLRSCPAAYDIAELNTMEFDDLEQRDSYRCTFFDSRRMYYEKFCRDRLQELTDRYDISPVVLEDAVLSPCILISLTKAELLKIQYDDSISGIYVYSPSEAAVNDEPGTDDNEKLYVDAYIQLLKDTGNYEEYRPGVAREIPDRCYRELYYHRDGDGEIDWALVWIQFGPEADEPYCMVAADRAIWVGSQSAAFPFNYGVYDVSRGKFFTVYELRERLDDYPGLNEALWKCRIGRPIGDADGDAYLTILDANRIQRALAGLDEIADEDEFTYDPYGTSGRLSDADRDGELTIFDVTFIQRRLARYED